MNEFLILSIIPFLLIFILLLIFNIRISIVMTIVYFFTLFMLSYFWKMNLDSIISATIYGSLVALEIFIIIFSILLLFNLLKNKGKLNELNKFIKSYTDDKNILIILVGFFLVNFFESIAGFGTPAAIAVPILIFLGIKPITAVVISLISDSFSVAFGAFGVPVSFGISTVKDINLDQIILYTGIMQSLILIFIPTILIIIYNFSIKKDIDSIKKYFPMSLIAGICFTLSYLFGTIFLSYEIISIFASITGFLLFTMYLKYSHYTKKNKKNYFKLFNAFSSYIVITLLLIISRLNLFSFKDILTSIGFTINLNKDLVFSLNFYSPGILIFLTFLIFLFLYKTNFNLAKKIFKKSFKRSSNALITLIFTIAFVQLLIYSNLNQTGTQSILYIIGEFFSKSGIFYIFLAPIIGSFGTFLSGSATVSNIIFANIQANVANFSNLSLSLVLALQLCGAALGNMIALYNVIAACSIAGIKNSEPIIIKKNLKVAFPILLIFGIIGFVILKLV